jgi:YVTN family beta-propeller protein
MGAGVYGPFRHRAGDGARLGGLPSGSGAFPLCHDLLQQRCFVIDTATNQVGDSVPIGVGSLPIGVAVTPDGTKVYVANFGSGAGASANVSVIHTATNTVVATIPVGEGPRGGRPLLGIIRLTPIVSYGICGSYTLRSTHGGKTFHCG